MKNSYTIALFTFLLAISPTQVFSLDTGIESCPVISEVAKKGELTDRTAIARQRAQKQCDDAKTDARLVGTTNLRCEVKCKSAGFLTRKSVCSWQAVYDRKATNPLIQAENTIDEFVSTDPLPQSSELETATVVAIAGGHAFYNLKYKGFDDPCGIKSFVTNGANEVIWSGALRAELPNPSDCSWQQPVAISLAEDVLAIRQIGIGYSFDQLLFYDFNNVLFKKLDLAAITKSYALNVMQDKDFIYVPTKGEIHVFSLKGDRVNTLEMKNINGLVKGSDGSVFIWSEEELSRIKGDKITAQIKFSQEIPRYHYLAQVKVVSENVIVALHTSYEPGKYYQNPWKRENVFVNRIDLVSQQQKIKKIDYKFEEPMHHEHYTHVRLTNPDVVIDQNGKIKKLSYLTTKTSAYGDFPGIYSITEEFVNTIYFDEQQQEDYRQRLRFGEYKRYNPYIDSSHTHFINVGDNVTIYFGQGGTLLYTKDNYLLKTEAKAARGPLMQFTQNAEAASVQFASTSQKSSSWLFSRKKGVEGCEYPWPITLEDERR